MTHRSTRALGLLAVAYLIAQVLLFSEGRFLSWDEAVYLGEVRPDGVLGLMEAHRARGIVALVTPPAVLGAGIATIRLYLAVVSAGFLFLVWREWIPALRRTAVLAAALFATSWLALHLGSEISPNLFVAFAVIAAAGVVVQIASAGPARRPLIVLAACIALTAFLRPIDSVAAAGGLAASLALTNRRTLLQPCVAMLVGGVVGWLPWIIEAFARFTNPLVRLQMAAEVTESAGQNMLLQHLALTDGPDVGPQVPPDVPVAGLLWWCAMFGFTAWALWRRRHDRDAGLITAAVAGLFVAVPYVFVAGALAPRFLLPSYGLLAVTTASGMVDVASRRWRAAPVGALVVALAVVSWSLWSAVFAMGFESHAMRMRELRRELGVAVDEVTDGRGCTFASQYGFPQVAYVSGCRGMIFDARSPEVPRFPDGAVPEWVVAAVPLPADSPLRGWAAHRVQGRPRWRLFARPGPTVGQRVQPDVPPEANRSYAEDGVLARG